MEYLEKNEKKKIWIKAAIEHRKVRIRYYCSKTDKDIEIRLVHPDFIGVSKNGIYGYWAYCEKAGGPRAFQPETMVIMEVLTDNFTPSIHSRYKEMENKPPGVL